MFQKTWKNKKIKLTSGLGRRIFKIASQGFTQAPIRPAKKRRKPLLASNFNRPPNYFNWLIKKFFIVALCGLAFFLILMAGLFFWHAQDLPKVAQIKSGQMVIPESTKIIAAKNCTNRRSQGLRLKKSSKKPKIIIKLPPINKPIKI